MHSPPSPSPQFRPARDVVQAQRNRIWARRAVAFSIYDRAILGALELHADADGITWVSVETLAAETSAGIRSVWRSLARLRAGGWVEARLEVTPRGRRNTWRVLFNRGAAPDAANDEASGVQGERASSAQGSCPSGRTHRASLAQPPPPTPSSDRDQLIDPPLVPPKGFAQPEPFVQPAAVQEEKDLNAASTKTKTRPEARDAVWSVLAYFMAVLHPESTGPIDTADRRRVVGARLQEFGGDAATLRDAVDGAKLSEWHASRDIGFRADVIFKSADTVEQLAGLARRKRRQDASARHGGPVTPLAPLKASPRGAYASAEAFAENAAADPVLQHIFGDDLGDALKRMAG